MAVVDVDAFQTDSSGRRTLPSFSLAERDRRYARVRALMTERNLDCLLAPATEAGEAQANSRYLCQIGGVQGGAWVIFPAVGEATAIVATERERAMWVANLLWPSDLRWGSFSQLVPERIRELGLERGRIGVVGLGDQFARPEGLILYETWQRVLAALPNATFVPASEVLERARVTKGAEEIEVVRRITEANEAAIARMMEVARPGREEADVWLAMATVLMAHTYDYPARLSLGSNGRQANASNTMALPIRMENGGILSQEIDARLQGYRAQCNHSILVGSQKAEAYREAMNAAVETFLELVAWVAPGKTVGEFLQAYERIANAKGGKATGMIFHTCGLGQDRPRTGARAFARDLDWVIEPGWTFTIKTQVGMEAAGVWALVGEPVTVDERGARRIGRRPLEPFATG